MQKRKGRSGEPQKDRPKCKIILSFKKELETHIQNDSRLGEIAINEEAAKILSINWGI